MIGNLRFLIGVPGSRYVQLVIYKVYADLVAEVERFYVGYFWWFLEPIFEMALYYIVFGLLLQRGTEDFVPFLLIGLILWKWFSSSVGLSVNSIVSNRGLLFQVYVPKIIFPATTVISNTVKFVIVFFVLLIFLIFYGYQPGVTWFSLPLILISCFVFVSSVALLVAAVIPFYNDLKVFVNTGLRLMFFVTGVFFPMSKIPEKYRMFVLLNPMATYIAEMRGVLMHNRWPDWLVLGLNSCASVVLFILAYSLISRLDNKYPKVV